MKYTLIKGNFIKIFNNKELLYKYVTGKRYYYGRIPDYELISEVKRNGFIIIKTN